MLWTLLATVPWLLPVHRDPWPTFYAEAAMALALLVPASALLLRSGESWRAGATEGVLVALVALPPLQALAGLYVYPAESLSAAACLAGFAMAVLIGRRAQAAWPFALADGLFAAFALAALASVGLAVCQWLEIDSLGLLVSPLVSGARPRANVGQSNNLATLLGWGLVGLFWLFQRERLGAASAAAGSLLLLFGIALTQSRTGWVQVGLLGAAAWLWRMHWRDRRTWVVVALLALVFAGLVVWLHSLGHLLAHDVAMTLSDQAEAGKRPRIWSVALHAVAARPWLGWGWNQGVLAHVALADLDPGLHVAVGHMHDIVLDLLVWCGLPLGLALCLASGAWWYRRLREPRDAQQALLLAALAVLGVHALLELPHLYAFFYLPAGLMIGTLCGRVPGGRVVRVPALAVGAAVTALAGWLAAAMVDYGQVEEGLQSFRLHELRIGLGELPPPPRPHVLVALQQQLEDQRVEPRRGMTGAELDRLQATASRAPTIGLLVRHARASVLNGRPAQAEWALRRVCSLHFELECDEVRREWEAGAAKEPERASVPFPMTSEPHRAGR